MHCNAKVWTKNVLIGFLAELYHSKKKQILTKMLDSQTTWCNCYSATVPVYTCKGLSVRFFPKYSFQVSNHRTVQWTMQNIAKGATTKTWTEIKIARLQKARITPKYGIYKMAIMSRRHLLGTSSSDIQSVSFFSVQNCERKLHKHLQKDILTAIGCLQKFLAIHTVSLVIGANQLQESKTKCMGLYPFQPSAAVLLQRLTVIKLLHTSQQIGLPRLSLS